MTVFSGDNPGNKGGDYNSLGLVDFVVLRVGVEYKPGQQFYDSAAKPRVP